eukprot:1697625-Ditylum_brightwellii.AAC.1
MKTTKKQLAHTLVADCRVDHLVVVGDSDLGCQELQSFFLFPLTSKREEIAIKFGKDPDHLDLGLDIKHEC